MACIRSSPEPSCFVEVGLPCETKCNTGASKSTSVVLLKLTILQHKALFTLHLKLQYFSASVLAFVTRLFHCWFGMGLGMRLVDNKIK